jgi:uncharacterized protein (TIGR02217 family)
MPFAGKIGQITNLARWAQRFRPWISALGWDGVQTQFQLTKRYASGTEDYLRPIKKPVQNMVQVAVGGDPKVLGTEYDVDYATGIVTFALAPDIGAEMTAGFEFDVPARFDSDAVQTSIAAFQAGEIPNVPIIEVRV